MSLIKKTIIGGIRLAAGAVSLAYRTGAVVVKGATKAGEFALDAYLANEGAKVYDAWENAANKINAEHGTSFTPEIIGFESIRRDQQKGYEAYKDTDGVLSGINNLETYLRPQPAS